MTQRHTPFGPQYSGDELSRVAQEGAGPLSAPALDKEQTP
ncbi:hypothetical protein RUA8715_02840 [Ruegeria arenilitoris]|uniref:Uncharacterized protein n=1 Tax=Ruegeria arenilitoris TaxID=1173585 RepID=A0A238KTU6_9RHOB|nr:hypothetical protein RUA8715_02840 [Ruegeria arenilitoris]